MMPHLWTLQTQYLASHPVELSNAAVVLFVIAFAAGWTLNHVANDQKNTSRRTQGKFLIAGREAETIEAKYRTADGKIHRTILLCSGKFPFLLAREQHVLTCAQDYGGLSGTRIMSAALRTHWLRV